MGEFLIAGLGGAWPGTARLGEAGLHTQRGGIPVAVRLDPAWHGMARLHTLHLTGCSSVARLGEAWRGMAGLGRARHGYTHCILSGVQKCGAAWARLGVARLGWAWRGVANTQHPCGGAEVCS